MKSTRRYTMDQRADLANITREEILEAAMSELWVRRSSEIRLEDIAKQVGVTVQTVLRIYGSRAKLLAEAWEGTRGNFTAKRDTAAPGDVEGTVRDLYEHYENVGDFVIRMLAEEDPKHEMAQWLARGREAHRKSIAKQLGPLLERHPASERRALLDASVAVCDVYTWKLFRRDMGRSRAEAEALVTHMLVSILGSRRGRTRDA